MDDLLSSLRKYGADVEGAMARFLGDADLYQTCFTVFLEDEAFQHLGDALAAKDYEKAFECAHTLKGVTGNMGLTPLYQVISQTVEVLRNGPTADLAEPYAQILAQLDQLKKMQG